MEVKRRVFLYGINTINLGDDLFFKIVLERYPNTEFVFIAPKSIKLFLENMRTV